MDYSSMTEVELEELRLDVLALLDELKDKTKSVNRSELEDELKIIDQELSKFT